MVLATSVNIASRHSIRKDDFFSFDGTFSRFSLRKRKDTAIILALESREPWRHGYALSFRNLSLHYDEHNYDISKINLVSCNFYGSNSLRFFS